MKCSKCGAELPEQAVVCTECQTPVENTPQEAGAFVAAQENGQNKKPMKWLMILIAAAAVIGIAVFAFVKLGAKDPKETVIQAFENIYTEDQVSPLEELFGLKAFAEASAKSDSEGGFSLKLDSISDESLNAYAGGGIRIAGRNDVTNQKTDVNMGVIYNGMDIVNLDIYYGEDTLMAAVPELSGKVFSLDLSDGLADRVKNSPVFGSALEESGVDVDGFAAYFDELIAQAEENQESGKTAFDLGALYDRYKEGCKAQDSFKAAMVVEKGESGTFTMDGQAVSCKGYDVMISKDAMIEFLRTSSDFFLQDETLKQDFLQQLEMTVRVSELVGDVAGAETLSAEELLKQSYDQAEDAVDQMIDYLEQSLNDLQMKVYVDKSGRLAAVNGTLLLNGEAYGLTENIEAAFDWQLQGGSYLTQNMTGTLDITSGEDVVKTSFKKQGSYDGKQLTGDVSFDLSIPGSESINAMFTSTYTADDGAYNLTLEGGQNGTPLFKAAAIGTVDQLEKGKEIHISIDSLEFASGDGSMNAVLSGEYYFNPLTEEITPPEGETMDVLAATEEDWNNVAMEMFIGLFGLMGNFE